MLGRNDVERYAIARINSGSDPHKWEFFQDLDVSQDYDFVGETHRMVEQYRGKLEALCREHPRTESEPDFTRAVWWE